MVIRKKHETTLGYQNHERGGTWRNYDGKYKTLICTFHVSKLVASTRFLRFIISSKQIPVSFSLYFFIIKTDSWLSKRLFGLEVSCKAALETLQRIWREDNPLSHSVYKIVKYILKILMYFQKFCGHLDL